MSNRSLYKYLHGGNLFPHILFHIFPSLLEVLPCPYRSWSCSIVLYGQYFPRLIFFLCVCKEEETYETPLNMNYLNSADHSCSKRSWLGFDRWEWHGKMKEIAIITYNTIFRIRFTYGNGHSVWLLAFKHPFVLRHQFY